MMRFFNTAILILAGGFLIGGCHHPIGGGHVLFDGKEVGSGGDVCYTATCEGVAYYVDRRSGKVVLYQAMKPQAQFKMDSQKLQNLLKQRHFDPSKSDMVLYMVPKGSMQCSLGGCR